MKDLAERTAGKLVKPIKRHGDVVFEIAGMELHGYTYFPDDRYGISLGEEEIVFELAAALREAGVKGK